MVLERRTELVALTEAAVAVALSVLLGSMRLVELPQGGSIALAALPLLTLALARGARIAVLAGACAGAAHAVMGGTIIHPVQLLLDYVLAYAAYGLAGIGGVTAARSRLQLVPRIALATVAHLACVVTSGMVFFAPVAGGAALGYSLAYNATTVLPESLLALWLVPMSVHAMARANPSDSWRRGLLEAPPMLARMPRPIHVPTSIDTMYVSHRHPDRAPSTPAPTPPRPQLQPQLVRSAPFTSRPAFATLRLTSVQPPRRAAGS